MLEDFILCEGRVGDGGKQACGSTQSFGILTQSDRVVGSQRPDPSDNRYAADRYLKR